MVVTDVPAAEDDKAEVEWILGKNGALGERFSTYILGHISMRMHISMRVHMPRYAARTAGDGKAQGG